MARVAKEKKIKKSESGGDSFIDKLIEITGNKNIVEGNSDENVTKCYISTGMMLLDYVISANDGVPDNKITMFLGQSGSGKTLICAKAAKNSILGNTTSGEKFKVIWFECEGSTSKEDLLKYGWTVEDLKQFAWVPITSVEKLKSQMWNILDAVETGKIKDRVFMVVDSVGMMASEKEIKTAQEDDGKVDMTRAKALNGLFRLICKKVEVARVPVLIINHGYKTQDFIPQLIVGGGEKATLGPSHILEMSKSQLKKGDDIVGINMNAKVYKSRRTKIKSKVSIPLYFNQEIDYLSGVDKWLKENKYDSELLSDITKLKQVMVEEFQTVDLTSE